MPLNWLHTIIQAQSSAALFQLCQMSRRGLLFSPPNVKSKLKVDAINYLVSGWNLMMMFARLNSPRRSSAESKKARGGPSYWSITSVGLVDVIISLKLDALWILQGLLKGPTTLYLAQSRHKSVQTVSNVGSRWTEIGSLVKSWNTNTTTTSCAKKDSRSSFFCFNDGSSVAHAPPAKQHTTTPAAPLHHTAHTVVVVV
jgi:hypothetical protein